MKLSGMHADRSRRLRAEGLHAVRTSGHMLWVKHAHDRSESSGNLQVTLGTQETDYQGFSIPIIELSDGTQINPATLDLAQLQELASDALSPCVLRVCCSPVPSYGGMRRGKMPCLAVLHCCGVTLECILCPPGSAAPHISTRQVHGRFTSCQNCIDCHASLPLTTCMLACMPPGIVPATWTFGTFTLTLSTGACGLAGTVGPDPSDPNGNWLAFADFVCETPELSWEQVGVGASESLLILQVGQTLPQRS